MFDNKERLQKGGRSSFVRQRNVAMVVGLLLAGGMTNSNRSSLAFVKRLDLSDFLQRDNSKKRQVDETLQALEEGRNRSQFNKNLIMFMP